MFQLVMKLAHVGEPVFLVHQEWKKISECHLRILKEDKKKHQHQPSTITSGFLTVAGNPQQIL